MNGLLQTRKEKQVFSGLKKNKNVYGRRFMMGCPTECIIGKNLTFSVTCHDPDTGILTDADSAPSYRVYEDETETAILTGTMSKLDDGNTTGFYTELIGCTAGNGFENDKTYTIYIEATVDLDTGGISYGFKVRDAVAEIIAGIADGSYDLQKMLRLIFAACCGKSTGGGGSPLNFRDSGDTKNRITAVVDSNGNRTGITLDGS